MLMANPEHIAILARGIRVWNAWRKERPDIQPDLSEANLATIVGPGLRVFSRVDFSNANLHRTNLGGTQLTGARFERAEMIDTNFMNAELISANFGHSYCLRVNFQCRFMMNSSFHRARVFESSFTGAGVTDSDLQYAEIADCELNGAVFANSNLSHAYLGRSDLRDANFDGANLTDANLEEVRLVRTRLEGAILNGCRVYGVSTWDLKLAGAEQTNLIITPRGEPTITVDNLEVAQFIYLLLNNERIRSVVDTITSKVVLILGRFTPDRKIVLDGIREELRKRDLLPVLFDFEGPVNRDVTETVSTLAHLARFIVADITDPRSIPQELQRIIPDLPSVPVQPILHSSSTEYGMFEHFRKYSWVLDICRYDRLDDILERLERVLIPRPT